MFSVVTFQILLCLAVKCSGVSIVWCSTMAWLIMLMRCNNTTIPPVAMNQSTETSDLARNHNLRNHSQLSSISNMSFAKFVIGTDSIALLFYSITMEAITTVAHVCAIILGIVLWRVTMRQHHQSSVWGIENVISTIWDIPSFEYTRPFAYFCFFFGETRIQLRGQWNPSFT